MLNTINQLADNLDIAGKVIPHNDLVQQVLIGLDEECTPIVVQINNNESISLYELQSLLITYEKRFEHLNAVKSGLASVNLNQDSINLVLSYIGGRFGYDGRNASYRGT